MRIKKNAADFGWPTALHVAAFGAVDRIIFHRILRCMQITTPDAAYLKIDPRYRHGFLDEASLRRYGQDPVNDLPPDFLDEALAKGDRCYGILDGEQLAGFGWYSEKPTKISDELVFSFGDRHTYMYKGFTHPDHRGKRLHAIGMTWALKEYRDAGFRGLVSHVYSHNLDSLRSVYRMGYKDVGRIYVARTFQRYWIHIDESCRRFGATLGTP